MIRRQRRAVHLVERTATRDTTASSHQVAVHQERSLAARSIVMTRRQKSAVAMEEAVPSLVHAMKAEDVVPITNVVVEKINATIRHPQSAVQMVMISGPVEKGNRAAWLRRAVIVPRRKSAARAERVLTLAVAVGRNAVTKTRGVAEMGIRPIQAALLPQEAVARNPDQTPADLF
ncbi:keratin associated protein 5-1 [Nannizzia gypsea CBS 118893]|uniref:Keratin associated protein 5-1 n=1 Tax=Arthroderma gypseum (strain ATCC MYA-4604 / CBS 118893) TaxID=535722 RepID=E4URE8_ARTGP|nr:keratin associated protein 5-1 [Nannizzia gypsea CBS 118893]EFQ99370.1 keratin associated protein 5-1 [Nannizzia gypsea CBS 118893]